MEKISWFGYGPLNRPYEREIEMALSEKVATFRGAIEGLEEISKRDFSVIVFTTPTSFEGLELPDEINIDDWVDTDCYIIKKVREIRSETPIIAIHNGTFPGYDEETAIEKYKKAGTTVCYNTIKDLTCKDLVEFLKQYL